MNRSILPLGNLFTPVLPHLVRAVSVIEDKALKDVSYYRETTKFVEELLSENDGKKIEVVGHCKSCD